MLLRNLFLIFSALLFIAGCEQTTDNEESDFEASINTTVLNGQPSTSFEQGQEIHISVTIKNISSESKTLSFNSGKQYDFVIKNENGDSVWRWSDGRGFITSLTSYVLEPNATKTFTYTWNQILSDGESLIPIGSYTLQADSLGIDLEPTQDLHITSAGNPASDFDVSLKITDKFEQTSTSFSQGEEINLILSITNISSETKTLEFSTTQLYDFVIVTSEDAEVWRWSDSMGFSQTLTSYDLGPEESKVFTVTWDRVLSDGVSVIPIGDYTLAADSFGIDVKPTQSLSIQ